MKTTTIKLYDNVKCKNKKYRGLGTVINIDKSNRNKYVYQVEFRNYDVLFIGNKNLEKVMEG